MTVYTIIPRYSGGKTDRISAEMADKLADVEMRGYLMFHNGEYGPMARDMARLTGIGGVIFTTGHEPLGGIIVHDFLTGKDVRFKGPTEYGQWVQLQERIGAFDVMP